MSYVRDVDTIFGFNGTTWISLVQLNASQIPYDNTISGLTATNVKTAIDELANGLNTLVAADISDFSTAANAALAGALAGKANVVHTHTLSNLLQSGATLNQVPVWNGSAWVAAGVVAANLDIVNLNASPTNPPTNNDLRFYAAERTVAPDLGLQYTNNFGNSYRLETSGFRKRQYKVDAIPGGTTFNYLGGWTAFTVTGTATLANLAITNFHQSMPRVEAAVTTAAVGAVAGWRGGQNTLRRGGGSGGIKNSNGGFRFLMRFGIGRGIAANTSRRLFAGLGTSIAAPTNVDPSSITNIIGVGADTADANWQIMTRGAGAVLKTNTGIPKAVGADNEATFELQMFSRTNNLGTSEVIISFRDITSGFALSSSPFIQTVTTNIPTEDDFLSPRLWGSTGATSATIGLSLMEIIAETEFFYG
jgi:hypothetical protein